MNLHYVFGMTPNFGGKPWSYIHYLAIHSAHVVNRPDHIYFWYHHEPRGEWWEKTKPLVTLKKIIAPTSVHGRPLRHPAHQADVVRLNVLRTYGGAYCDCDVLCLRPFAELNHCGFWMGRQHADYGLCHATMGGDPDAPFVRRWLEEYKTFRSRGRDRYWDEHSVKLPYQLAKAHPTEITIFDRFHFFDPDWRHIRTVFDQPGDLLAQSYSVHLWETFSWPWLSQLTPDTWNRQSELAVRLSAAGVL